MKKPEHGLRPSFSPYKRINQVPLVEVQQALCRIFERRNKPGSFRVDNGDPFGRPTTDTPPPLALWLIAHGIDMIWNKAHSPQMNGVVEHLQDTSSRWAEIQNCRSYEELQRRLDEEAHIQRCVFPVSRLGNKNRREVFPNLERSDRDWVPSAFCPQRAYEFLSKKVFNRRVSPNGQINHFGQSISSLGKWKGQFVQLRLNATTLDWEISHNYQTVKKYSALPNLSQERLLNLSVFHRIWATTS